MTKVIEWHNLAKTRRLRLISLILKKKLTFQIDRRYWVLPSRGNNGFWEDTVSLWSDDKLWVENFRMTRNTFIFICQELRLHLTKKDTRLRGSISVEKRVAICLWHLATGEDLRSLGWRFGIAKSTACEIIKEVCKAIVEVLLTRVIKWPSGNELKAVTNGFKTRWGFPQCAGAIDGTHIKISAPPDCPNDYYNRKGDYSIVLQAVVDHEYRFTDIYIKWPGKVHDARILSNSALYLNGKNGKLFPNWTENISGCDVPITLIGDPAYPLLPWLMRGYQDKGKLTPEQVAFNYGLSKARMVIEAAFGRLKGRFRCLFNRSDTSLKYLPTKIASCCVLHNLCEVRGDTLEGEDTNTTCSDDNLDVESQSTNTAAKEIRDALATYFSAN
ncbi:hypothetical protein QZH41_011088 [Actinostola sp. cb2023]|nr:hypothetical protein QZH41_011088 [Actinostola sp. cb2023]